MKAKNFRLSLKYAGAGIAYAFTRERNMRIHGAVTVLVILASYFLKVSWLEFGLIIFSIALVITAEMINTAIERVVDLVTEDYHPLAAIIKNVSAGAVLITALNAIIIGLIVFPKYLLSLVK